MVRKKRSPSKSTNKRLSNESKMKGNKSDVVQKDLRNVKKKTMNVLVQHNPRVISMTRKVYKEIKQLQRSTINLIPRLPFQRVIRELLQQYCRNDSFRIQIEALRALQEAAELYLTQFFEDSYFCSLHAKRKTLMVSDMQCVRRLRGRVDIINH